MRRWLAHSRTLLQALTWLLLVLYPFAVWFGVSRWGMQLLAPLLAVLFTLRLLSLRGGCRNGVFFFRCIDFISGPDLA